MRGLGGIGFKESWLSQILSYIIKLQSDPKGCIRPWYEMLILSVSFDFQKSCMYNLDLPITFDPFRVIKNLILKEEDRILFSNFY